MPGRVFVGAKLSEIVSASCSYLVFLLDGQRYALPPAVVEKVLQAEPVTRLPDSPEWLLGICRHRRQLLPVLSLRLLMGMPERSIDRDSRFIVMRLLGRRTILVVDEVEGLSDSPQGELVSLERFPASGLIEGVVPDPSGLILLVRNPDGTCGG